MKNTYNLGPFNHNIYKGILSCYLTALSTSNSILYTQIEVFPILKFWPLIPELNKTEIFC